VDTGFFIKGGEVTQPVAEMHAEASTQRLWQDDNWTDASV